MIVRKAYKTPIELIFWKVFKREMNVEERRILLGVVSRRKNKDKNRPN